VPVILCRCDATIATICSGPGPVTVAGMQRQAATREVWSWQMPARALQRYVQSC
jgi:hypothetical protein